MGVEHSIVGFQTVQARCIAHVGIWSDLVPAGGIDDHISYL